MNRHWLNIGYCDCENICKRWQIYDDNSQGWFCPYVPENIEHDTNKCKKLSILGKDIGPTIVLTNNKNN